MKKLLEYILTELLQNDQFTVEEVDENDRVTLTIKVPTESTGLIIGKGGKTIKAIRNLIKVLATLEKKGVFIQIAEN
jgi:predicted RNA-binding protein YlqC (UPF0109 family)